MVAVVLLGNGLVPPKWRGGACLMAGVCPNPENSPDPIGVPVNPGGGRTPERDGWAPDRREIPGREMLLSALPGQSFHSATVHGDTPMAVEMGLPGHGGIPMYGSRVK